jgi:hypothetical protein
MRGMITVSILKAGNSEPLRAIGNVSRQEKSMNFTHWLDFSRHARPLTLLEGFAYDSILKLFSFRQDAFVTFFWSSFERFLKIF